MPKSYSKCRQQTDAIMKRELIEDFLLSELAEVKGGQASKDCHCSSGAAETIILEPIEDEPTDPSYPPEGPIWC